MPPFVMHSLQILPIAFASASPSLGAQGEWHVVYLPV
jgi:hypothetical protein